MSRQYSDTMRDGWLSFYETTLGTSPKLRYLTGLPPANCAASQTGTQLIEMTLPSDWQAAPSGGSAAKAGTWSGVVSSDGTAGYYRFLTSGGVCHEQGLITRAFSLTTNGTTAANNNVLNFASTAGVSDGMTVNGTGVPAGTTVLAHTSTTVTLSAPSTAGVGSSVAIYFGDTSGDLWLQNTVLATGTTITVDTRTQTAPGA